MCIYYRGFHSHYVVEDIAVESNPQVDEHLKCLNARKSNEINRSANVLKDVGTWKRVQPSRVERGVPIKVDSWHMSKRCQCSSTPSF